MKARGGLKVVPNEKEKGRFLSQGDDIQKLMKTLETHESAGNRASSGIKAVVEVEEEEEATEMLRRKEGKSVPRVPPRRTDPPAFPSRTLLLLLQVLALLLSNAGVAHCRKFNEPSEFLRSFLTRPQLLRNATNVRGPPIRRSDALALSLVVDNWSPYPLKYSAHSVVSGTPDPSFPPRDMPATQRGFAIRVTGEVSGGRLSDRTGGMVGWTLMNPDDGAQMARLSAAWQISSGGGDRQEFSVSLGDEVPAYDDMWRETSGSGLETKVGKEVFRQVAVADLRVTVAAELQRLGDTHYRLRLVVVPQNVDIWYWEKYFKNKSSGKSSSSSQSSTTKALPKTVKNNKQSSYSPSSKNAAQKEEESRPLYYRNDLLKEGPALIDLHDKEMSTLRDALRSDAAKKHSVAVGLQIENWTRFKLGAPSVEIDSGKLLKGGWMAPREVLPGRQDAAIVGNSGALRGTGGVVRWPVGSSAGGKVLSVMWSVPYNMQFWSTWTAVGITAASDAPPYDRMYSKKDASRYARVKSGREFEFSDGELIAMAYMDGGASSKPVLRVRLLPRDDEDLAASVRKRLGLPVTRRDDIEERSAGDDVPQVGKVVNSSPAPAFSSLWLLLLLPLLSRAA